MGFLVTVVLSKPNLRLPSFSLSCFCFFFSSHSGFSTFIRKSRFLQVLKVGCIAVRHLNTNNDDFSFL